MLLPTMHIELVITIKPLPTEATQRMSLEATLVLSPWVVITLRHMHLQLLVRKQIVLVRKHFLMPCAEITHLLVVSTPYVAVQFWPCTTRNITRRFWAVVVQKDK